MRTRNTDKTSPSWLRRIAATKATNPIRAGTGYDSKAGARGEGAARRSNDQHLANSGGGCENSAKTNRSGAGSNATKSSGVTTQWTNWEGWGTANEAMWLSKCPFSIAPPPSGSVSASTGTAEFDVFSECTGAPNRPLSSNPQCTITTAQRGSTVNATSRRNRFIAGLDPAAATFVGQGRTVNQHL